MMGTQHKVVGIGFGIATALYVAEGLGEPAPAMLSMAAATVGCMLPDIDHDRSRIGRKRKFVTNLLGKLTKAGISVLLVVTVLLMILLYMGLLSINLDMSTLVLSLGGLLGVVLFTRVAQNSENIKWLTKHRGLMHTLIPPALILFASSASINAYWRYTFLGLGIGYLSHILADMLTVEGCPVLFPLSKSNKRFLKLKTKNKSTWLAAIALAVVPICLTIMLLGGV